MSNEAKPWIQLLKHTIGNLNRFSLVGGGWISIHEKSFEYCSDFYAFLRKQMATCLVILGSAPIF